MPSADDVAVQELTMLIQHGRDREAVELATRLLTLLAGDGRGPFAPSAPLDRMGDSPDADLPAPGAR